MLKIIPWGFTLLVPNQTLLLSAALSEPFYHLLKENQTQNSFETGQPDIPGFCRSHDSVSSHMEAATQGTHCMWPRTVHHEYLMSLNLIPHLTPTLPLLLENSKPLLLWRTVTSSRIPFPMHILRAVVEILWCSFVLRSWSISNKAAAMSRL